MTLLDRLVGLYAPHCCVGCDTEGSILCTACRQGLVRPPSCCYRCLRPTAGGRTCTPCRPDSPLLSVNAVAVYDGTAKQLVKALKFGRAMAAAHEIAASMAGQYSGSIASDVLLVPVPTARQRVRKRGYDQSVLIARSLATQSAGSYVPALMRLGAQEQKGAGRQQRRQQLAGAYLVRRPQRVRDARILLVDDVLTTGSTVEEAALALRAAGAQVVGALVFARVD